MKTAFKTKLVTLLAATVMSLPALAAQYNLKFQSSDPAGNPNFELQKGWTQEVEKATNGQVKIELMPVNSIVSHRETQDAIAAGILDGHVTDTSYFAGKDPVFGLIANPVGAWSDPHEMLDFMNKGGGSELMNELLAPYGLHFIGATTPGLEAFVSRKPLNGVADLKGLKVRAPEGLVQQVFAAAGAAPVNLPGSEVFTSLDKGVIEAADYTVFSTNHAQGMHKVAPHPVYPGFHSMPLVEISMNKAKWDALPKDIQATLTETVRAFALKQIDALAAADLKAVEEAKAAGVTIHNWSAEERAKFRKIAIGEWEKAAAKSASSRKAYEALTDYLVKNGLVSK